MIDYEQNNQGLYSMSRMRQTSWAERVGPRRRIMIHTKTMRRSMIIRQSGKSPSGCCKSMKHCVLAPTLCVARQSVGAGSMVHWAA